MQETVFYKLNIEWETIAKLAVLVIGLFCVYFLKEIIIYFLFALIIATLFNYIIDILKKKGVPRVVSTTFLYLLFFGSFGFFIYKTAPLIFIETQEFLEKMPEYLNQISPFLKKIGITYTQNNQALITTVQQNLVRAGDNIISALVIFFGGAVSAIFVIAVSFFISLEGNFVEKIIGVFAIKEKHKEYFLGLWRRARKKIGGWFLTRLIGILFVGLFTYAVLVVFNVKYSFLLALIAGIMDILPFFGPLLAAVVLFSLSAFNSIGQAIFVLVFYLLIQQIENQILFPLLFKRFIELPAVLVLLSFAIGAKLWGIAGSILAIPLAGVIYEIIKDYLSYKKHRYRALVHSLENKNI